MNTIEPAQKPLVAADLAGEADFRLGALLCRPSLLTVTASARTETLEPRIMLVLVVLARHKGEVLGRERLVDLCWNGRVVGDDAIQRCIARLRKVSEALGGFELETIRRVGYRLTEVPATDSAQSLASAPLDASRTGTSHWWLAVPVLLALVAALFFLPLRDPPVATPPAATVTTIAELIDQDRYGEAFTLAHPLRADPATRSAELDALWQRIVLPMRPAIAEDGATMWFKPYDDLDGPWIPGGVSPFATPIDAPRGTLRLKVEKPGFDTGYFVIANPGPSLVTGKPLKLMHVELQDEPLALPLAPSGTLPEDMVLVPRTDIPVTLGGWAQGIPGNFRYDIPAFAIARHEVTNREFKEFVDAGGYDDPRWWQDLDFVDEGRHLTWEEARARFVDGTGSPGPAGWQLSAYPSGEAGFPVGGISWYEAMAYARFRGAMLPTIHHWARAAATAYDIGFPTTPAIVLQSRFLAAGPVAVTADKGLGPWGTVGMAGNVAEWAWNHAGDDALVLGGNWNDYPNIGLRPNAMPPMMRMPHHGMRLMRTPAPAELPADLLAPIALLPSEAFTTREPVDDAAFAEMRAQFVATRAEPVAQRVEIFQESDLWVAEDVRLGYADGSTAALVIVRPRGPNGALQPIVYGPPNGCCVMKRSNREALENLVHSEYLVRSGRAVIMPIWATSYERFRPDAPEGSEERAAETRAEALGHFEDINRTLAYLATRDDMDMERVGFLGISYGAQPLGGVLLAMEPRIKAAVLISAGLAPVGGTHPMKDIVNYAPRITAPVLLVNGRFDHVHGEAGQRRLFDLLGTPLERKAQLFFDQGHIPFANNTMAREVSGWFDKYLGAVQRGAVRPAAGD